MNKTSLACGPSVLGVAEAPAPFAATLETEWLPGRARIVERVVSLMAGQPANDRDPRPA